MAKHKYGYEWRKHNRKDQIKDSHSIDIQYINTPLANFIADLNEAADGLDDPQVDTDIDYGQYGDYDRTVMRVTGWRTPTAAEIAHAEKQLQDEEDRKQMVVDKDIRELNRLRKLYPNA